MVTPYPLICTTPTPSQNPKHPPILEIKLEKEKAG